MLQTKRVATLEQVRQVAQALCRSMDRESAYAFMLDTLVRFHYRNCSRPNQGLPRSHMTRLTGFSRAQLTRLIAQYMDHGRIVDRRRRGPVRAFPRRYTDQDIRLPAKVDESLGQMSGPATRKVLQHMYRVFGDPDHERLSGISNGHLYNLRKSRTYRRWRNVYCPTRPTPVAIGVRARPDPGASPDTCGSTPCTRATAMGSRGST